MRAVDVFVMQLDQLWDHSWESLTDTLDGIAEAEASWAAPCYAAADSIAGPAPGSVWWHIHHLAFCKHGYMAQVRATLHGDSDFLDSRPLPLAESFAAELARLADVHREQRDLIATLQDSDLERRVDGMGTLALPHRDDPSRRVAWRTDRDSPPTVVTAALAGCCRSAFDARGRDFEHSAHG